MKRMKFAMILLATGSSFLAACSSGSEAGTGSGGEDRPGVRTVAVSALDSLRFEPAEIRVQSGEMVRFVVTNEGSGEHEFVLGDEATQMEHEGEMGMGGSME
ncbi:MAG: cupredoxin domain-containing protein, partial [Actinomycetota bacterium]